MGSGIGGWVLQNKNVLAMEIYGPNTSILSLSRSPVGYVSGVEGVVDRGPHGRLEAV